MMDAMIYQCERAERLKRLSESRRGFLRQAAMAGAGILAAPLLASPPAEAFDMDSALGPAAQKRLGHMAAESILKKYKKVTDGRARHFDAIGQRLVAALPAEDRTAWPFSFTVLEVDKINAFALPGGHVFLFTGLYSKLETDDALAGVLGHEMTHVRKQHWANAAEKRIAREIGISALLLLFRANSEVRSVAGFADEMVTLKYSRGEEDEADAGGLVNMIEAGYNPEGLLNLFQILQRLHGSNGIFGTDFLSDHPLTRDRISNTQERIAALRAKHAFPALTALRYASLK